MQLFSSPSDDVPGDLSKYACKLADRPIFNAHIDARQYIKGIATECDAVIKNALKAEEDVAGKN